MTAPDSLAIDLSAGTIETLSRHAAAALISSVWQGILLFSAVAVCFFFRPTTAKLRFTVWIAAYTVLATLPFLNIFFRNQSASAVFHSGNPQLHLDVSWSYAFVAAWLAAVLIRTVSLAFQTVKLRSLWRSATPVADQIIGSSALAFEMGQENFPLRTFSRPFRSTRPRVECCTSTELDRPSVIGFFSPRILIPAWLFPGLTPGELDQIVLHELEHLRRHDDWLNLLQKIGLVLFPLNPALFWIDRRLATERELACDDGVLGRTRAPRAYATCLTTLAEHRLKHSRPNRLTVLALGVTGAIRRSDLSRRIESILAPQSDRRAPLNPAFAGASAVLLLAGSIGSAVILAHAPQLVSFTEATQDQTQSAAQSHAVLALKAPATRSDPAMFENVVFHPEQPAVGNSPAPRPSKRKAKVHRVSRGPQFDVVNPENTQRTNTAGMVLTNWRPSVPQPVLVTLPDGRTFLAAYAANPDHSGWLLIQL